MLLQLTFQNKLVVQQSLDWLQEKRSQWQVADFLSLKLVDCPLQLWQAPSREVQLH